MLTLMLANRQRKRGNLGVIRIRSGSVTRRTIAAESTSDPVLLFHF